MTDPEIVVSPGAPFSVEVVVFEEDTWRVLSAGNQVRETRAPLESLQVEAEMQQPHKPGDVVVRGNRWFAILHNFDEQRTYEPKVTLTALKLTAGLVAEHQIESIALQALGSHHGPDSLDEALDRIRQTDWPVGLSRIWVIA